MGHQEKQIIQIDDVKFSVDVRDITKIDSKIFQLNTIQSVVILR